MGSEHGDSGVNKQICVQPQTGEENQMVKARNHSNRGDHPGQEGWKKRFFLGGAGHLDRTLGLGEESSKEREQYGQRPGGGTVLDVLEKQGPGKGGEIGK